MSDSETSDININVIDNKGKVNNKSETKKSSDTDYYMNLLANENKTVPDKQEMSPDSEIINSDSVSSKESSSRSSSSSNSSKSRKSSSSRNKTEHGIPSTNINTHTHKGTDKSDYQQHQQPFVVPIIIPQLTPQEIRIKKIELLRKLSEIKAKVFSLTKEYDFNSSTEEMEYEFALLKSFVDKRNGVKIFKSGLLQTVSIIEFLNDKYDPFEFHLQGWGEHMSIEVDSYDDVLEEIYEKYKGTGKGMPPEIKLLLLIVASASAFHFTKSQSLPISQKQTGSILNSVLNGKKQTSQFMTEQEINLERIRDELKNKAQQQPQQPQQQQPQQQPQQPQQFQQQQQQTPQQFPRQSEPVAANAKPQMQPHLPAPTPTTIRQPENVKDILSRIHNLQSVDMTAKLNNNTDTQEESVTNDRLLSESTLSESSKKKKVKQSARISVI